MFIKNLFHTLKRRIPFMNEKRQFKRYRCKLKARFVYFDIDEETNEVRTSGGKSCKGHILDISQGGIFIATNSNPGINRPVKVSFRTNSEIIEENGIIVRTGLMKNNPSEILKKFENISVSEKAYVAIQFENSLDIDFSDICN